LPLEFRGLTATLSNFAGIDRQADLIVYRIPLAPRWGEKTFQPHDANGSRERWTKSACEPEKKHEERVDDEKSDDHGMGHLSVIPRRGRLL
jgi:hypothetical protein